MYSKKASVQITHEIGKGNYVESLVRPQIVSGLGAIPKPNSEKIRLIHDMRRSGLNELVSDTSVSYSTVDEATKFMHVNSFVCKVDLSQAYRSVPVHPSCYRFTGLSWRFEDEKRDRFFFDTNA